MAVSSDAASERATCDVCGAEKHPSLLDETSVATIAPMEATVCKACQHVQDHELPEDCCMQCGDSIGTGFYLEVEFPLGAAALPGFMSGTLCGECASWIACDINYDGVSADEDAHERHLELIERDRELPAEA